MGAAVGMVGVVGGPAVAVTEPTAMLIGGGAGWLAGMISCSSSTGSGGGEEAVTLRIRNSAKMKLENWNKVPVNLRTN